MRNDILLFVGIIIFFFVLWIYSGGPNKPISFAGPYITPITDVGTTQIGYGDGIDYGSANDYNTTNSSGGSFLSRWFGGSSDVNIPAADQSSYAGKVSLDGGNPGTTDLQEEYMTIRSESDAPINVTGWQLKSVKTSAQGVIGTGARIADKGGVRRDELSPIVLAPYGEAIVSSGRSPIEDSFLETKCTGYLDENDSFTPSLGHSCPDPVDELANQYGGNTKSYDQCYDYVSTLGSCRTTFSDENDVPNSCQNFVDARLTYSGCVSSHRSDSDFYGDTWRVYLGSTRELWRTAGDTIELLDVSGKVVDVYSY
jgi:hypothetical protein